MFVKTRSSVLKNEIGDSCQTVVFNSKKKNGIVSYRKKPVNADEEKNRKESELDLKKLRYEVIKFGSSGLDGSKRKESRVALAVALGATPPKRKCRNYTEIIAEKKAEAKNKGKFVRNNTTKSFGQRGKSKLKRSNRKGRGGLLGSYGKVKPEK